MSIDGYNHYTQAKSLGICLLGLPDIIETERPDWLLLSGDRGEQLMGAIAAAYTYTPVAHIQAGELSGNIDGMTRHAIGKFVHMHFASNQDAADRLVKLGEQPFRVFNVGAPQVDELVEESYASFGNISEKLNIEIANGYILAVFHPVTEEASHAGEQAKIIIRALNKFAYPKILILPNNDAGTMYVREAIENYRTGIYHMFANLSRSDYLGLLKNCLCIVGNSSSGLLEAPSFKKAAVNIGNRQKGRLQGINVINSAFNIDEICYSINKAISIEFTNTLINHCINPYGDGRSSERILDLLIRTKIDDNWLNKSLTY
jgi:UDP-hydrolysing UDP-N-acetyl-D-glucosamine 2-epimerase